MASTRTIMGIDPGTARTGWGVIEAAGNKRRFLACGLISTPAGETPARRLRTLAEAVDGLLAEHRPDGVALEKLFFAANAKTAIAVAEARGVILSACAGASLEVAEYTPMQVKQGVSGYGGADKRQVGQMVERLLGLKEAPKPDDVADALAIALCHGNRPLQFDRA